MYIHSTIITKSNSNNGNDNQRFRFRLPVPRLFRHFVLKSINLEFSLFSAWTSMSLENLGVYLILYELVSVGAGFFLVLTQ